MQIKFKIPPEFAQTIISARVDRINRSFPIKEKLRLLKEIMELQKLATSDGIDEVLLFEAINKRKVAINLL